MGDRSIIEQMPIRTLFAALGLTLLLMAPSQAVADWTGDEAYIRKLQLQLTKLKTAVALFERHQRELELVEAEIANVQLGLADPRGEPVQLVRKVLGSAFPKIRISMTRISTRAPTGVSVWRWRCVLKGAVEEIRWATQLLRQKGLFILPDAKEPVQLRLRANQRTGALSFIGHHIRLKESVTGTASEASSGADAYVNRTDHLANKIKQLRTEIAILRRKVEGIRGFEARITAIKQYLTRLRKLTRKAKDPFRAITPLLDLELVNFDTLSHQGRRVMIKGTALSASARRAAMRWLKRSPVKGVKYVPERLVARANAGTHRQLELPKLDVGGGGRFVLVAQSARPVDIALAAARNGAVVAVGRSSRVVSGRTKQAPFYMALGAPASALGQALIRDGKHVLLLPRERNTKAINALNSGKRPRRGRKLSLLRGVGYGEALTLVRSFTSMLEAPRRAIDAVEPTLLAGRARPLTWLRLLGAAQGLQLVVDKRGKAAQLRPANGSKTESYPVPDPTRTKNVEDPRRGTRHGLSTLRLRLLVLAGRRRSFAVVSAGDGLPLLVRRRAILGKNHSQVVKIDKRGLTLLWSGDGVTARIVLPSGPPTHKRQPTKRQPTKRQPTKR
jgi:hypothetical protein